MSMTLSRTADLQAERLAFDSYLNQILSSQDDTGNGVVYEAMRYAVLGSAQRIRPILALRIARMVKGGPLDTVMRLASSIELLHCASLIIDDLPCMDDSPYRRERASTHVKFGEATTVLAAFGLVALAARNVLEPAGREEYRPRLIEFQLALLRSLDCSGLIAGQSLDLHPRSSPRERAGEISELKTVPLFSLAVMAGSLLAKLDVNEKALLNCFGREFGMAFQMSDDLLDGELIDHAASEQLARDGPGVKRSTQMPSDLLPSMAVRDRALCASEELAQEGLGVKRSAQMPSDFLPSMAVRDRALCASEEPAQDGLGVKRSAQMPSDLLPSMAVRDRALCASEELAQDGLGVKRSAPLPSDFVPSMAVRDRALCAFEEKLSTLRAAISPFGAAAEPLEDLILYLHARV